MRTILNISLPEKMAKQVKKEAKEGGFTGVSEFMRHLIRSYNNERLIGQIKKDKKRFEAGEGILLESFSELDEK